MFAHSPAWCQCNSLTPPAVSRIFTPAMVFEIGKSACVTCRAQPPFWMRRGGVIERGPNLGHAANVGCRRRKCRRKLIPDRRVLRPWVRDARWIFGVDGALRRLVRI